MVAGYAQRVAGGSMRVPPTVHLLVILQAIGCGDAAAANAAVPQWSAFGRALIAQRRYDNPYTDVELVVTFTAGSRNRTALGFWDGGDVGRSVWRWSTFFATPGAWHWSTHARAPNGTRIVDIGLESSGSVEVSPAPPAAGSSGNPFVTHGSLRVAQSGTHLEHHSGRSFFYHSDTGYSGPRLSTEREWQAYLTTRKSQGFSVVQVAIAQGDPLNGKPFVNRPGGVLPFLDGLNMTKLNPPWFQQYASRLAAAGDAGLGVVIVGIMQPISFHGGFPATDAAVRFARALTARLAGMSHVMYSPSFDSGYMDLGNEVGRALVDAGVSGHQLLTLHVGTGLNNELSYYNVSDGGVWDFYGEQTGYGEGGYRPDRSSSGYQREKEESFWAAQNWSSILSQQLPVVKPVVDLEAWYDAGGCVSSGNDCNPGHCACSWCAGNASTARAVAYIARLSGAVGGTTYGSWVMSWNTTNSSCTYWQRHLHLESAYQMGYMRWLFEVGITPTHWSTLRPAPHRLVEAAPGGATNPTAAIALAQSVSDGTVVAYLLPANARVKFQISQGDRHASRASGGLWWNPSSNSTEAAHCEAASHSHSRAMTTGGDSNPTDGTAFVSRTMIVACSKPSHWEDAVLIYR